MSAELKVTITGDASRLSQAFGSAKVQAQAFANSIRQSVVGSIANQFAALASVGVITGLSAKTIQFAGHMRDLADTLKVNVEWLQKLRNAAKASGGDENTIARFMQRVQQSRESAATNPGGKQAAAFGRLGFSAGEVSGPSSLNAQAFAEKIMKAFAEGGAQAENDVITVGGRTAFKLVNAFRQGIEEAGPIMSEDLVDQLDEIGDEFEILKTQLMVDLAPAIIMVSKAISKLLGSYGQYNEVMSSLMAGSTQLELGTAAKGLFKGMFTFDEGKAKEGKAEFQNSGIAKVAGNLFNAIFTFDETKAKEAKELFWKFFGDIWKSAQDAAVTKEGEQELTREQMREQRKREREERRKRENEGFNFDGAAGDKKFKVEKIQQDALSKSGLFTASGMLARAEIRIEQEQLNVLRTIADNTGEQTETPYTE